MSEQFKALKQGQEADRRRVLARLPLWSRVKLALLRAQALSEANATLTERVSHGKLGSEAPPDVTGLVLEDIPASVYDHYSMRILSVVEELEAELDAQQRRPSSAD